MNKTKIQAIAGIIFTVYLFLLLPATVRDPGIGRWWWKDVKAYTDGVSSHRMTVIPVDSVIDQTMLKFALEDDIVIERISFFAQDTTTGDTTALKIYEGTLLIDSLVIPVQTQYLEFTTDINLSDDSSFVEFKLDDAGFGGTAAGGPNGRFVVTSKVRRQ